MQSNFSRNKASVEANVAPGTARYFGGVCGQNKSDIVLTTVEGVENRYGKEVARTTANEPGAAWESP